MKKVFLFSSAILLAISSVFGQDKSEVDEALANKIIAIEKAALEEWNKGNPDGYLNIYANDYITIARHGGEPLNGGLEDIGIVVRFLALEDHAESPCRCCWRPAARANRSPGG